MNCKQGDLAMIIYSNYPEQIGKTVTCVSFVGENIFSNPNDYWEVEAPWYIRKIKTGKLLFDELIKFESERLMEPTK